MSPVYSDPIRSILNQTRGRGNMVDLLNQSIELCMGLWFLDKDTISRLRDSTISREDFKDAVYQHLKKNDPDAAVSFQAYAQARPLEDNTFRELFLHWVEFSRDKNRLCRLTDRLVYPNLSRVYRPDLAVPEWLERLACELLPDTGSTFWDGTAGAGSMALRIAHYRQGKNLPLQVATSETDPLLFHLSVLRAKMHGFHFKQSNTDCLDTLKSLESQDAQDVQYMPPKADISVMFPPLQGGRAVSVSDSVLCGGDWSYAYCQLNALNEAGVGICRIPNGALFNARNQAFREYLLDLNVIDAVIALPKQSSSLWAAVPATSLVVFRRGRKEDGAVRMMELPVPGSTGHKNELHRMSLYQTKYLLHMLETSSMWIRRSELDASNLSPQRYLSVPRSNGVSVGTVQDVQNTGDGRIGSSVQLGEVAVIYRGLNVANLPRRADGAGVLRLSDVQNGRICMDDIARYDLMHRNADRYRIRAGDVLLSCKGKAVKLCVVSEDMPLLLSHDFLGIRVDPDKLDPQYLYYFLQSPAGQWLIRQIQMGSSIMMIRAADLERLTLHYIPLALQKQYASELHSANALIDSRFEALNASRQRVYAQFYHKIGLEDDEL